MTKTKPWEVFHVFLRLGLTSFGGPIAHLGYFRNELVSRRRWISEEHYGQLVGLCQFLPGPASSQVGFALGFIRGGYLGAVAAWTAFTLPSALLLVLFAIGAVNLDGAIAEGLVIGLKAVAVAVVAHAVWGMAKSLTPDLRRILIGIVAVALVLLLPSNIGQIGAIVAGIIAGIIWCRHLVQTQPAPLSVAISKYVGIISVVLFAVLLFGLPIITALWEDPWVSLTDAFYRAGALVFGGGHVVLPLLQAEPAVTEAVSQDQFLAGYGAAQAVPGPLFTFAAFLGFGMGSGGSAWLSAALALVSVFLPGILLLLATLPFWSKIQQNQVARSAVLGANAAVVGIMTAALITPIITEGITGYATLIIAVGCFALLLFAKVPAWSVVLIGGLVGVVASVTDVGLTWV